MAIEAIIKNKGFEMNKKRISTGFWVWGQFDRQSEVKVEAAKEKVNNALNGPKFESHITLSGPMLEANNNTREVLYQISNDSLKFTIYSEGLDYKDRFFQALFIKIKEETELLTLKRQIDTSLKLKSVEYFPHISLFYGDATSEAKDKIIKKLNSPEELTLESISLVDVNEGISSWKVVERFPLK